MASQSSKSASSSSISISKYDYDVFLSFCREDVGRSFADHLYAALVKKGLRPFREATSASESLKAIEKSKAFIVMFSRNYDDFNNLLPELVKSSGIEKQRENQFFRFSTVWIHLTCGNKGAVMVKHFPNTKQSMRRQK